MAFATIALAELVFVYSVRSSTQPAWAGPRNRALAWSVLVSASLVLLAVYLPFARGLLGAHALSASELVLVLVLALAPTVLVEAGKALVGRRSSHEHTDRR
jgi:magnesium-transporting ATPase (P-type)